MALRCTSTGKDCDYCYPCRCSCHRRPGVYHCKPCCHTCTECGQRHRKQFSSPDLMAKIRSAKAKAA